MKLWYSRAFGPLRNIMNITMSFTKQSTIQTECKYFVELTYEMFPEIQEEFPDLYFKKTELIELMERVYVDD